jgi:hypothetical protein
MKEQQRAEAVVETVPEDPSRPDSAQTRCNDLLRAE